MRANIFDVMQSMADLRNIYNEKLMELFDKYSKELFGQPPSIDKDGNVYEGKKPDFDKLNNILSMLI